MALGDYILCAGCECKLIYDGDRGQREWWAERWGKEPEIFCPDCSGAHKQVAHLIKQGHRTTFVRDAVQQLPDGEYILYVRDDTMPKIA